MRTILDDERNLGTLQASTPPHAGLQRAIALMRAHKARYQAAMYPVGYTAIPQDAASEPFAVSGYATYADFFPMFDVPFAHGGGWDASQDDAHASVVVISSRLNRQLFAGADSVGRTVRLDDHDYRVIGVTADWNPRPRFYDLANDNGFGDPPDFFLPFTRAVDLQTETSGNDATSAASVGNRLPISEMAAIKAPEISALATSPHISPAFPSLRRRLRNCPRRSAHRHRHPAYRSA